MNKNFTKSDLETGMIVETETGALLLVLNGILVNDNSWLDLSHYNDDLTRYTWMCDSYRDIVKVYETNRSQTLDDMRKNKKLIWDRNAYTEMTIEEVQKELGYKIKIIE